MDIFYSLKIYIQVVENESFTNAADSLQILPSTVTKTIKALEKKLQVRLLNRTTRQISLTSEGEIFYKHSIEILKGLNQAFDAVKVVNKTPKGKLRVGLPVSFATSLIIPALPDFCRLYPDIELVISVTDHMEQIVNNGLDCALRVGTLPDSGLIAKSLGSAQMITTASPKYLKQHGEPKDLEALNESHTALLYFTQPSTKIIPWQFIVKGEVINIKMKKTILFDQTDAYLAAAIAGLGILQTLQPILKPYIDKGELIPILQSFESTQRPIAFVYPDKKYLAPKVQVFMNWVICLINEKKIIHNP